MLHRVSTLETRLYDVLLKGYIIMDGSVDSCCLLGNTRCVDFSTGLEPLMINHGEKPLK